MSVRVIRFECPVDGCDWLLDDDVSPVPLTALADQFGVGVMRLLDINERAEKREKALREHFEAHPVLDWLKTVMKLQAELKEVQEELWRSRG